jgi:hypothetical protein
VLGVSPDASPDEVHRAYRDRARLLHPDRQAAASPAERIEADRRMRELNEAWRVLRQREHTGRAFEPAPVPRRAGEPDDEVAVAPDVGPVLGTVLRSLPWVIILGVFAFIFVFTAYAGQRDAEPAPAPRPEPAVVGSCVRVSPGPSTTVVPCDEPNTGRVAARVPDRRSCPAGTEARRLGTDGDFDCLAPVP